MLPVGIDTEAGRRRLQGIGSLLTHEPRRGLGTLVGDRHGTCEPGTAGNGGGDTPAGMKSSAAPSRRTHLSKQSLPPAREDGAIEQRGWPAFHATGASAWWLSRTRCTGSNSSASGGLGVRSAEYEDRAIRQLRGDASPAGELEGPRWRSRSRWSGRTARRLRVDPARTASTSTLPSGCRKRFDGLARGEHARDRGPRSGVGSYSSAESVGTSGSVSARDEHVAIGQQDRRMAVARVGHRPGGSSPAVGVGAGRRVARSPAPFRHRATWRCSPPSPDHCLCGPGPLCGS